MIREGYTGRIVWVVIFGIAMAFVESAVVVYLRAIYYPGGFAFPLKPLVDYKIFVEVLREIATLFMLISVACLAGRKAMERFAFFILSFGIWDIFYYIWLKVLLDWPSSLFTWDILFLIPLPWIGPVIAPVSISVLMIIFSMFILRLYKKGSGFRAGIMSFILALAATAVILYSFMHDTGATLHQQKPEPYRYELLILGNVLFAAAFVVSYLKTKKTGEGREARGYGKG